MKQWSKIEPKIANHSIDYLGRKLRVWKKMKLSDTHALKVLRLWLGYEFIDVMDAKGRISVFFFNEVRRRLGYKLMEDMMTQLKRSESFYIVGKNENEIDYIASTNWYQYDHCDGVLLPGSYIEKPVANGVAFSNALMTKNIDYPTGGNGTPFSCEEEALKNDPVAEIDRTVHQRKQIVKDYFLWVREQTDGDHASLMSDIRYALKTPRDKQGAIIADKVLGDEEADMALEILLTEVMPQTFYTRDDFFKESYMKNPAARLWWMKGFFRKYARKQYARTRYLLEKRIKDITVERIRQDEQNERNNHPLSPFEWMSADGTRKYDFKGCVYIIPKDAPVRTDENRFYSNMIKKWI